MQLMTASQASRDVDKNLERSKRAYEIITAVISEADTKLVTESGTMTPQETKALSEEIKRYKASLVDVLFTYLNCHRLNENYAEANNLAREHTQVAKDAYGGESKNYTYALMVQAQCMAKMRFADHSKSLNVINQALQKQLEICAKGG